MGLEYVEDGKQISSKCSSIDMNMTFKVKKGSLYLKARASFFNCAINPP